MTSERGIFFLFLGAMENVNAQLANRKSREIMTFVASTLLLIGTWCLLLMYLLGLGEGLWRCVGPMSQAGSKTISDFLKAVLDSVLPAAIITGISAGIFVVRTVRTKATPRLLLLLAVLNLAFVASDLVLGNIAYNINLALLSSPLPVGTSICHYTWPHIPVTAILLFALFLAQSKLALKRT